MRRAQANVRELPAETGRRAQHHFCHQLACWGFSEPDRLHSNKERGPMLGRSRAVVHTSPMLLQHCRLQYTLLDVQLPTQILTGIWYIGCDTVRPFVSEVLGNACEYN